MHRLSATLTIAAAAAFIISGLLFALAGPGALAPGGGAPAAPMQMQLLFPLATHEGAAGANTGGTVGDLSLRMLQPGDMILWLLLVLVWAALAWHAARILFHQLRTERAAALIRSAPQAELLVDGQAGPPSLMQQVAAHGADHAPVELAPLALALAAGALWPWLASVAPALSLALAGAMMLAAIAAVVRGQRDGGHIRQSAALGLFAGWATAAAFASFAVFITRTTPVPADVAGVIAVVICSATGVMVQLQLGAATSYSVGLIWSLVGLATITMNSAPVTTLAAILGISAMAIVLVRAAS